MAGYSDTSSLRIDAERFRRDFDRLARIGTTGDGGVHRPALGQHHLEARAWFRERIVADGLESVVDGAGNHVARLASCNPAATTLLMGSHLDSVPRGGRFDGALGVLAAFEVLRTVRDAGLRLPLHLEAIDFTDEEGALIGLLGSRALTGALTDEELQDPRCGEESWAATLDRAGLSSAGILGCRRDPRELAGFLELHIEQGPRLASAGVDIGVVTSIVGIGSFELTLRGRADHAGTTPMDARRDAGVGAAELITRATAEVTERFPGCVVNFGRLELQPGAYNIVPGAATLALEFRAPEAGQLQALESALLEWARDCAERRGLELAVRPTARLEPAPCAPQARRALTGAAERLGLSHVELPSGAGHDTMALAAVCPSGMLFVPSTGGSHSSREMAAWPACVHGANVLLHAALDWPTP